MGARPTINERVDRWLNVQADLTDIPDVQRQAFIDHMRRTAGCEAMRLRFAVDDLWDDSGVPRGLQRLVKWLDRWLQRWAR